MTDGSQGLDALCFIDPYDHPLFTILAELTLLSLASARPQTRASCWPFTKRTLAWKRDVHPRPLSRARRSTSAERIGQRLRGSRNCSALSQVRSAPSPTMDPRCSTPTQTHGAKSKQKRWEWRQWWSSHRAERLETQSGCTCNAASSRLTPGACKFALPRVHGARE